MENFLEILQVCPLFFDIQEDELLRMLSCLGATVKTVPRRQAILSEGEKATSIGIVLSGTAQIEQNDYDGNRSILSSVHAGEVFAEAFACASIAALPVSVVASEPCEVMLISRDHILHTCSNHCAFHQRLIYNLMRDLAAKTILFHQKIEVTSKRSTREKLMTYLAQQAKRAGSLSFDIPFNRQELADYLEVERSGLSAEIGKLQREGVLISNRRHFQLL